MLSADPPGAPRLRRAPIAPARLAASALSGAMFFLASPKWDLWPLGWIAVVPLLWAMRGQTPRRAALYAWVAGLVTHGGGFYWIVGLLQRFGHFPLALALPVYSLLAAYQALVFAAFGWSYARVRAGTSLPAALVAPVAMVAFELVMPFLFPCYLAISQAWVLPIIQIADVTGPLGVTFLMFLAGGALWDVVERGGAAWRPAIAAAATIALALGYGAFRIRQVDARRAAAPKRTVGSVQANVGISEKGSVALAGRHHALHLELTRELERRGADLVVWPESSYPYFYWRHMRQDWPVSDPRRLMTDLRTPVLFGAVTFGRGAPHPYNSALLARPDGTLDGPYDKNMLLLFGEYVPLYDELDIKRWIPASSNFARGADTRLFEIGGMRIGPMICYEDIIPSFARRLVALRPNLLVNLTNDAWFGATSEPWQHLALAVFRSVEARLDLVRSVNTGVTAFIDATGRVRQKIRSVDPQAEPDVAPMTLLGEVALMEPGSVYASVGDVFGWLALAALAAMLWRSRRATASGA